MDLFSDVFIAGNSMQKRVFLLGHFLGTMSAIPVLWYGFSSLLTVWSFFLTETWNGFPFLRTIDFNPILVEWVSMFMMLGAPLVALVINLFRMVEHWWETTVFVWYVSVSLYFTAFTIVVVVYEVKAAYTIVLWNVETDDKRFKLKEFVMRAFVNTQNRVWCGCKEQKRVTNYTTYSIPDSRTLMPSGWILRRWYTRMTQSKFFSFLFEPVDPPQKFPQLNDVLSTRQFITRNNWSIERSLFLGSGSQNMVVLSGNAALTHQQIVSSMVCMGLSILALLMVILGFLRWFEVPLFVYAISAVLIGAACYPRITTIWRYFYAYRKHMSKDNENDKGSRVHNRGDNHTENNYGSEVWIYQSTETYQVSRPTWTLRIVFLVLHYGTFYLFPIATLIRLGKHNCSTASYCVEEIEMG